MIQIAKTSNLLKLPEELYGTIKRVGILNNEPILYGDVNLLKNNDLYYISSAKQVYRYIKTDTTPICYFDVIKQISTDGLLVPEEERGHIRNAGYLFNEIIYSGDPNLVENGSLFYHNTLPYISIVSNVDGVINLSTKELDEEGEITTVITEYRVSPEPQHDYSKDYLTFEALEDGTFTLTIPDIIGTSIITHVSYSIDNGKSWNKTNNVSSSTIIITTPTVYKGNKVLWKGVAESYGSTTKTGIHSASFSSTQQFKVYGNILSLLQEDEFENAQTSIVPIFGSIFEGATELVNAENLIFPNAELADGCYYCMFQDCTSLVNAPELPATTLATYCYYSMFQGCTSLTTAPVLPATTLAEGCYVNMFNGCTNLNYIKAMFTVMLQGATNNWVSGVAAQGTFVKNVNATWNTTGANGVPTGWTVQTAEPEPSDEITI